MLTVNPTKTTAEVVEDLGLTSTGNGKPAPLSSKAAAEIPLRIASEWDRFRLAHPDGTTSLGTCMNAADHKILQAMVQNYAAGCLATGQRHHELSCPP